MSGIMAKPVLFQSVLRPEGDPADRSALFLHGLLGRGSNLRPVAQGLMRAQPRTLSVLLDLRMHGRSQGFAPPHSLSASAADVLALESTLDPPVRAVVGHSFGGKVALAYHRERPELEQLVLLDSAPGARVEREGSEQTLAVVELLARLPPTFAKREDFIARIQDEGHSRMVADWLAMNLERTDTGFRLRVELPAIRALLDDYFTQDLWPVLEGSRARIDVVIGGRSRVWNQDDKERLRALSDASNGRVRMHVLPSAGHWVHVDDLPGVLRALE